jgi:hypothetical protein
VIRANRADKSPALRDIVKTYRAPDRGSELRVIPLQPSPLKDQYNSGEVPFEPDLGLQDWMGNYGTKMTLLSFEGFSNTDNEAVLGFRVVPPDPNGDVGPNHYVQMINLVFGVWDKSGTLLLGPLPNDALWAGFGGLCEFSNDGDPIVLYDPLADRWLLTQFVAGSKQCVACSETGDPTGAYFRYEFPTPGNDYPKHGVWPEAYTFTYSDISVFGFDIQVGALERDKILVGDPTAQMVLFPIFPTLGVTEIYGVLPVDLDGPPPPPGTPMIFLGPQADGIGLAMWELSVDWTNPGSSTLDGPFFLPTEPFDMGNVGVPQPFPGDVLDGLPRYMMHRLAFRDFGTHMAMVANHTVDVGGFDDHAGIRWYELRNDGSGWSIFQQGTYAPDSDHRWMGSIAMDSNGNIALGYSVSGETTFPSIRYTGRTANAPLGEMNVVEQSIMEGSGVQGGSYRWGDYSMLAVDPVDDATFWYTNEYYAQTSSFNFQTRIGKFNLEPLTGPQIQVLPSNMDFGFLVVGQSEGPATVTIGNIGDADLTITGISDPGAPFSLSHVPRLPRTIPLFGSETFEVTFEPTAGGSFSSTITISSNDPDDPTVDVALSGESVDLSGIDALIWNPTGALTVEQVVAQAAKAKGKAKEITAPEVRALIKDQSSSADEIAAALDANGISNETMSILPLLLPPNIHYVFVVLGQFPARVVVYDGSDEATVIESFVSGGGHVYMEGGDVWFFDPRFRAGHDFGPTFGIHSIDDGARGGELNTVLGSHLAAGQDFAYVVGSDNYLDRIGPAESGFLVHTNDSPQFGCGVANPLAGGSGRTIGTSFEFGQLVDGASPATKTELMANYIDFFDNGFVLGQGPQILITPDSIDFGVTSVGDVTAPVTVTINSGGTADLTISAISYPGFPFVYSDLPILPAVIPASGHETFRVSFTPTISGVINATISVNSDDGNDPTVDVALTAEGTILAEAISSHETPEFRTAVTNEGTIGMLSAAGLPGWQWPLDANQLFEGGIMVGIGPDQVSDGARVITRSLWYALDEDFLFTSNIDTLAANSDSTAYRTSYNDDRVTYPPLANDGPNSPLPVKIVQTTYSYTDAVNSGYLIFKLEVINTGSSALNDLLVGMFHDWDINNWWINTGEVVFESVTVPGVNNGNPFPAEFARLFDSSNPSPYLGAVPLSQNVFRASIIADRPHEVFPLSEAKKYNYMHSRRGNVPFGDPFGPDDKTLVVGVGGGTAGNDPDPGFDLGPGDTAIVGIAIVGGNDAQDFVENGTAAMAKWVGLGNELTVLTALVGIASEENTIPMEFALEQNYPNPFNPNTTIEFALPHSCFVTLKIFNMLGEEVATLVDDAKDPGTYRAPWDASGMASGVYFYRLQARLSSPSVGEQAGDFVATKKLLLLK